MWLLLHGPIFFPQLCGTFDALQVGSHPDNGAYVGESPEAKEEKEEVFRSEKTWMLDEECESRVRETWLGSVRCEFDSRKTTVAAHLNVWRHAKLNKLDGKIADVELSLKRCQ